MGKKSEIVRIDPADLDLADSVNGAVLAWAGGSTNKESLRKVDLLRDKSRIVADFLAFAGKSPEEIRAGDVLAWQEELERRGLTPPTIYAAVSKVSSFYTYLDKTWPGRFPVNPVIGARPKAPKAYTSESTSSISDEEIADLVAVVRAKADSGSIVGKRDYALVLHFALTGRRRAEVIRLRRRDIKTNGIMLIEYRVKGGEIEARPVDAELVKVAMLDYLEASGRPWESLKPSSPIWTRHDRAGKPGKALTSHAFAKNLKGYAAEAGLPEFHLHQLRHTFARKAQDKTRSLAEVQELLGHKHPGTTRRYVQRVGLRRDNVSDRIAEDWGLK